ncbi:MAG: rhodanese-related sulfurtransferase [Cyanobacteria bacterium P01_H01_bin.58]
MPFVVATFYKFVPLQDCVDLQRSLQALCTTQELRGTILLAEEGINATVSGTEIGVAQMLTALNADPRFADLTVKQAIAKEQPFARMKVKIKREIVTFGQPSANPAQQVGTYISPQDWNQIITDPDVLLIDTRNDYEVNIGTFQGATNPHTESFSDFPTYIQNNLDPTRHKKVAMFCTGGIRCEKATSYLLDQGFESVYHLEGGILKYLEEVPAKESLWKGECFVFDERVTVQHGLEPGNYDLCRACGSPISETDQRSPHYEPCVSCPHCYAKMTPQKRAKQVMRKLQYEQKQRVTARQKPTGANLYLTDSTLTP